MKAQTRKHMSPVEQHQATLQEFALNDYEGQITFVLEDTDTIMVVKVLDIFTYAWMAVDMGQGAQGSWNLGSANEIARKMVEIEDDAQLVFELVA